MLWKGIVFHKKKKIQTHKRTANEALGTEPGAVLCTIHLLQFNSVYKRNAHICTCMHSSWEIQGSSLSVEMNSHQRAAQRGLANDTDTWKSAIVRARETPAWPIGGSIGGSPVTKATGDPARIYWSPADQPGTSLHNSPSHPLLISPSLSSSTLYQPVQAQRIRLDLRTHCNAESAPKTNAWARGAAGG